MPSTEAEPRPMFRVMSRRGEGRVLGGVAGGLAEHLGVRVVWVRAVFLLLVLCQGAGLFCYAALWLLRPLDQEHPGHARGAGLANQRARAVDWALILVALVGLALLNSAQGVSWVSLIAVAIGAALLWRALDGAVKRKHGASSWFTSAGWIWVGTGSGVVIAGLAVVLVAQIDLSALRAAFLAVAVTLVGVGLILLPVLAKLWRSLAAERAAHAREEERARLAAHLHDSALQTLTLIQKQAENPREVIRLARGGERELRQWLFEPQPEADEGLHEALRKVVAQVEDDHRVRVGAVFVGEPSANFCPEHAEALVGATREALVNAAKHSGALDIALYVESDGDGSAVYVRDRGAGFDPAAVEADRRGVAVSIIDRTRRQRGRAEVRSEIGGGTEVRLWVPA